MSEQIKPPEPGNTSIRMGPASLRPAREKDHFELMRSIITVRNDGERIETEQQAELIGPLAIYRIKRKGDKSATLAEQAEGGPPRELKSADTTGKPIDLILVWYPGMEK